MGRHQRGDSSTMVSSSIALLQERFRELERVREKREEKELLKLFTDTERHHDPNRSSFHPEMIPPHRPPLQESLSLGLNSQGRTGSRARTVPTMTNLWPNSSAAAVASRNIDNNSDVDTSLHL